VTTPPAALAVAEQCEKPLGSVIVGLVGIVNAEGSVAVMVLPFASAPTEEGVNPTVQVETVLATVLAGVNVTLVARCP